MNALAECLKNIKKKVNDLGYDVSVHLVLFSDSSGGVRVDFEANCIQANHNGEFEVTRTKAECWLFNFKTEDEFRELTAKFLTQAYFPISRTLRV